MGETLETGRDGRGLCLQLWWARCYQVLLSGHKERQGHETKWGDYICRGRYSKTAWFGSFLTSLLATLWSGWSIRVAWGTQYFRVLGRLSTKDPCLKKTASRFQGMGTHTHSVKMGENPDTPLFSTCFTEKPYTSSVNEKTYKQTKTENDIARLRYFICEISTKCLDIFRKYPATHTKWNSEKKTYQIIKVSLVTHPFSLKWLKSRKITNA